MRAYEIYWFIAICLAKIQKSIKRKIIITSREEA